MGCRYCLNECCYTLWIHGKLQCCYTYTKVGWNVAIHTRKVHNGMQVLPECCYRYMNGKFTMGCRYCLNVVIDTWKVHNGMQVLPECCYTYMESCCYTYKRGAGTANECCYRYMESLQWVCRYCHVVIDTRKVHSGMQVLPECCYRYMESSQWDAGTAWWDAGTAWMLL